MPQNDVEKLYKEHFSPCLAKATHLLVEKGEGPYLFLQNGEKYLDMVQGIAVNALGHSHPSIVEAACGQIKKIIHGSYNLVNFPSTLDFAVELKKVTPQGIDMFFFSNSGAEAVEGGLKLARYATRKPAWIAFRGSFHGRTMGAASVTSSSAGFRKNYAPFLPQVYFAPFPNCYRCSFGKECETCNLECLEYLKEDLNLIVPADDVSAVLIEPVQGEGGYIVPPVKYMKALRALCDEHGFLLICDEIQAGMGRTGKMFASEHFDIKPDIICMGKAVGAGFPLSVVAASKDLMQKWPAGAHGTTFGGHPVAAAAALAQIKILSQKTFLEEVSEKGAYFRSQLKALAKIYPEIGDVRGLGLMNAIEFVKDDKAPDPATAQAIQKYFFEKKILILPCGVNKNALRFIPPLNISKELLDTVLQVLEDGLKATQN